MWLLLWLGCGARDVAPYLRPAAVSGAPVEAPAPPGDLQEAVAQLVGEDPFVRRPDPGLPGRFAGVEGGAGLEAWAALARRAWPSPDQLAALEAAHRGTPAVALARGLALGLLETRLLAPGSEDAESVGELLPWLGPLVRDERPLPSDARGPLEWLGPLSPAEARQAALRLAERRVLLGWLDGPAIPLGPVAARMEPPLYDRLLAEPAGALIRARGLGARDPQAGARGAELLQQATALALEEVAADRDAEQRAWRERRDAAVLSLGLGPGQDPVATLLERARSALVLDAAEDRSAGLALVALSAARLHGPCPPGACRDLDRTATLARAETWSPRVAPLARAWQVYALKAAADAVEVTLARPSFGALLPDLLDALAGTGEARFPANLLRRSKPTPQLFLDLSRGSGGPDQVDAPGLLDNLRERLARTCDAALAVEQAPELRPLLQRIRPAAAPR